MKSLTVILKENLEKSVEEVDESKFGNAAKKFGSSARDRAKKAGKSIWDFAKDVVTQNHVSRN